MIACVCVCVCGGGGVCVCVCVCYNFPFLCRASHAAQHHSVTIHNHRAQIKPALRLKTPTDYFLPVLSVPKLGRGGGGGGGMGCWSTEAVGWEGRGAGGRGGMRGRGDFHTHRMHKSLYLTDRKKKRKRKKNLLFVRFCLPVL